MDFVLTFPEQLGLHLKSLRKAAGLRQAELAALLGVSQSRVAAIEKDPASVSVGQFFSILKLLNADLVIRQQDPAQNRKLSRESTPKTSATDYVKQQGLVSSTALEQALGMSAADYVKKHGLAGGTGVGPSLETSVADYVKQQQGLVSSTALEQALGMSAADYVKKHGLAGGTGVGPSLETSVADYVKQQQGLVSSTALEQALGMSAADYVKKHDLTVRTVTLKPQDLPINWQNKKPKGSW